MAPVVSASQSAPLFGGHRGGKIRADGLPAGSLAAKEADRRKDRERKARAAAAKAEPPPLPSAVPGVAGAPPSPAAAQLLDLASQVSGEGAPVPWQPDSLRPLFEQLIEAAEESRVGNFIRKCSEAGLTGKLVKEIQEDAHFPKPAKVLLCRSLPRLAAKLMNKSGLSAEYEDEVAVVSALLLVVQNDWKLANRLEEVIAANKAEGRAKEAKEAKP